MRTFVQCFLVTLLALDIFTVGTLAVRGWPTRLVRSGANWIPERINDWSRHHRQETRLADVGWQPQFELPVLGQYFFFELSLSLLPAIPKRTFFFVQSGFEFFLERLNAMGQVLLDLSHLVTFLPYSE